MIEVIVGPGTVTLTVAIIVVIPDVYAARVVVIPGDVTVEAAAVKDVVLAEITNRYQLYRTVFDRIFDERKEAIDRHFDIIDRGIAGGDKQLILAGLEGLSRIVSSSPFANIQELSKLLESGKKIEF